MVRKANISYVLEKSIRENDLLQKEAAVMTKTPNATLSGHVQGGKVTFEKAMEYLEAFEHEGYTEAASNMTQAFSYDYLGFIKGMDGQLADVCTTAELEIFQDVEEEERKERKRRAEFLVVQSKIRPLDACEHNELEDYALEFLDEIIVELAIVFSILKVTGLDIRQAIKIKMPEWKAKKYMR